MKSFPFVWRAFLILNGFIIAFVKLLIFIIVNSCKYDAWLDPTYPVKFCYGFAQKNDVNVKSNVIFALAIKHWFGSSVG